MKTEWGVWCGGCRGSGVQGQSGTHETLSQERKEGM